MFTCALFCTHYVGNVIYHKFSHGDVSYRFNGENINVKLELSMFVSFMSTFVFILLTRAICWERAVPLAVRWCRFYLMPFQLDMCSVRCIWQDVEWNSIVSVPDHCLFIYFSNSTPCPPPSPPPHTHTHTPTHLSRSVLMWLCTKLYLFLPVSRRYSTRERNN